MINDMNNFHISYIKNKIAEFLECQDIATKTEWYCTDFEMCSGVFADFIRFLDRENVAKEKRRKLYEELKKEFE